jgi:D-xylose 1-dehydrogenase (NADP+, D-xylono-1,5-lactone-forming)
VRDTRERRLGWGVLGAAWIAGRAVVPAIEASRNGRLVAIASRDLDRARRVAAQTSARICESYDALLADPSVDAVYIPLVNSLHREWTLRAFAAHKHVLCEKPLAMNAAEAEEMAAAATSASMHLMEAFMYRFHPRMRDFVDGLRDVLHVQASFGFSLEDRSNYRLRPELGGGALLDVGCYTVNVSRWILGEPHDVLARARSNDVDMTMSALLQFPGGATASLWASFESAEEQELTVVTAKGVHRLENPFTYTQEVDQYQLMVESFADSVLQGRPVAIPPTESIANMRVLDRIREAAAI